MTKYVKITYSEEEFDEIMAYGLYDFIYEVHGDSLKILEKKEKRKNDGRQY